MRATPASVSVALALGLLLTACSSGEEQAPQAAGQCDGTLSPAAVTAAGSVLGGREYRTEGMTLGRIAQTLTEDWGTKGRPPGHPEMCEIVTGSPVTELDIRVRLYEDLDLYDDGADKWGDHGRYLYAMGRETSTDNETASVFVQCTSPRLKGSDRQPAPIGASLKYDKPIKGAYPANTAATREAYLTVLHSVTLAVVKELGCENDAGLPAEPVFEAKKWKSEK